jgi:hypothetical protein
LAFILDPDESHAQGNAFLKLFLEILNIESKDKNIILNHLDGDQKVKVNCEYTTNTSRRIDILISFGEKFHIAIENKIYLWTSDQINQLSDYSKYLESKGNYILLYLAPGGKDPIEESLTIIERTKLEKENKFKIINYEDHIIPFITKCIHYCKAERVRTFLGELESYFKKIYLKEQFMETNELIKKYSMENLEVAFAVVDGIDQVKRELFQEFQRQLDSLATNLGLSVEISPEIGFTKYHGFYFYKSSWKHVKIGFEFEGHYGKRFFYGIRNNDPNSHNEKLVEFIREKLNGPHTEWWPWWNWVNPESINFSSKDYLAIPTEQLISLIRRKLEPIKILLDEYYLINL